MVKNDPPRRVLISVPEWCDGCRMCEMVCSLQHTGSINPSLARIRVIRPKAGGAYPVVCRQCKDPLCQSACPVPGAMTRDERSGAAVINEAKCTGCLACVEACPFGAIQVGPNHEILKCDLCGGDPECVKYCQPREQLPDFKWPRQPCLRFVEPRRAAATGGKANHPINGRRSGK